MKDALDTIPAEPSDRKIDQPLDQEVFANRKLIRPSLSRGNGNDHGHNGNHGNHSSNHSSGHSSGHGERRERSVSATGGAGAKKASPAEQTNAENFYYQKQMQSKTPMVIVLRDGEEVHGIIEWYDKTCLKLNRSGAPNLMIYKPAIKYMFKEGEARR